MKAQDWTALWRMFVREKGDRHLKPIRSHSGFWVCITCNVVEEIDGRETWSGHSFRSRSFEYSNPHEWARFVYRHNIGCARSAIRALPPVAALIISWSAPDRDLESKLMAVSDRDTEAAAVLEDFYLEREFTVPVLKRAIRKWKREQPIVNITVTGINGKPIDLSGMTATWSSK